MSRGEGKLQAVFAAQMRERQRLLFKPFCSCSSGCYCPSTLHQPTALYPYSPPLTCYPPPLPSPATPLPSPHLPLPQPPPPTLYRHPLHTPLTLYRHPPQHSTATPSTHTSPSPPLPFSPGTPRYLNCSPCLILCCALWCLGCVMANRCSTRRATASYNSSSTWPAWEPGGEGGGARKGGRVRM